MGAGLAAAGRPLGATVEVQLQRHGARRVEEQCQNDTVQILFFFIIIIIIIIFFFLICGDPKMGYNSWQEIKYFDHFLERTLFFSINN